MTKQNNENRHKMLCDEIYDLYILRKTIRDTLIDLANYAIITVMEIDDLNQ